ncbi:hypothetical protein ACJMK2_027316, partial [Sinanodonta woodiana]
SDLPPPKTSIQETVDSVQFWSDIDTTFIIKGITKGLQTINDVTPSYEYWGPWIGKESRHGNALYNTEFRKRPQVDANEYGEPVPEELLKSLLQDEKVSVIRRLCRQMGIRPEGSAMDMIVRMREKSVSKGPFDLAYEKVFGTSGGWVLGACPHGVVYAIKSLLRSESPRDYVDLLRSFKHRPNIIIADIAHLIASHGNKTQRNFFYPNEGRLAAPDDNNIALSKTKEPIFEINFQHHLRAEDQEINPTSGSSEHYALFDWFHEGNTKNEVESLRNISLLKEFSGIIDSQILEQRFSSLKRDLYFLNQMLPATHMFVFRLLIHLQNQHCNKRVMDKQMKAFGGSCCLNEYGQLSFHNQYSMRETIPYQYRNTDVLLPNEQFDDQFLNPTEPFNLPVSEGIPDHNMHATLDSLDSLLLQTNNINSDARDCRLQIVEDICRHALDSFSELSSENIQNLQHNLKYAQAILFRRAELNRYVIQLQGNTNYCGLCCINKALGPTEDANFPVSIEEMDLVADLLWIGMAQNPALGVITKLEELREKEGFYSMEVIEAVLQRHSTECVRIHASVIHALSPEEFISSIQSLSSSIIFIIHPAHSEHWLTMKYDEADFILIDSKKPYLTHMSSSKALEYIRRNSQGNGAVFLLRNTSRQSKLSEASEKEKGKVSVGRDYGSEYDELSNTTKVIFETVLKYLL